MYKKPSHTNSPYEKPLYKHYENKYFLESLIKSISTKQKYIITARIPQLLLKKKLLFFFTEYKNEWEQNIFRQQQQKK